MQHLPVYVYIVFAITFVLTVGLFYKATGYAKPFLTVLIVWVTLQSILGLKGFYSDANTSTARFPLLFLPPLLALIFRFITKKGRVFIDKLDMPTLTLLSVIRIPVELVLFWLFVHKSIPEAMTFHGRNFDIFSGLTAPLVYYFGFKKHQISYKLMLVWNFICVALLINVVANAILSLPGRYASFGYDQPNVALCYFPFLLLPACIVPLVMFSMLASIRQLLIKIKKEKAEHSISII